MDVPARLATRREAILALWRRAIFESYPGPTADLLRRGKDRFRNPAGDAIRRGTEEVLDALIRGASRDELAGPLDRIVRLRAVQDFAPSAAVAFVFDLKRAIRAAEAADGDDLAVLDRTVDGLALLAFDLHSACREKIGEIRVAEARARLGRRLERAEAVLAEREERIG
jgi:hypothetical protein